MGSWSELPWDLLSSIARRLDTLADVARFSSVCRNWSSLSKSEITNLPRNPPWLMLTEKPDSDVRVFVNADGKRFSRSLPNITESRCIGSTGYWVVMYDEPWDVYILNPFTDEKISLPSFCSYRFVRRRFHRRHPVHKVILSFPKSRSPRDSDFIAVAIHDETKTLSYTRKGSKSWKFIICDEDSFLDVIFYQDKFYAVNEFGFVFEFNIDCSLDEYPEAVRVSDDMPADGLWRRKHLVECQGMLLLVLHLQKSFNMGTWGFQVCKLDLKSGKWMKFYDLGQHSIFLGLNTSVSLLATSYSAFKPNCIYFSTEEHVKVWDDGKLVIIGEVVNIGKVINTGKVGIFSPAETIIVPYYTGSKSHSVSPNPVWIVPT